MKLLAFSRKFEYSSQSQIFGRCQVSNYDSYGGNDRASWNDDITQKNNDGLLLSIAEKYSQK